MKFIVHNIKIWFNEEDSPRKLEFLPNKVNVITGDSRTGKSNILAIIDYCLLSINNNIIDDIINQSAKWYSIDITLNNYDFFIARRRGWNGSPDSTVCLIAGKQEEKYPTANILLTSARDTINKAYKEQLKDNDDEFQFRDSLPVNYLTEEIISASSMYFDFAYLYSGKFDFSIYNFYSNLPKQIAELKSIVRDIEKTKKDYENWIERTVTKERKFNESIEKIIESARKAKILDTSIRELNLDEQINRLDVAIRLYKNVARQDSRISALPTLRKKHARLISRRNAIHRLNKEYENYLANMSDIKDSILPIEIIQNSSKEIARSYETGALINALEKSLLDIKSLFNNAYSPQYVDNAVISELECEISAIDKQIKELKKNLQEVPVYSSEAFSIMGELRAKLSIAKVSRRGRKLEEPAKPLDNYLEVISNHKITLQNLESKKNNLLKELEKHIASYLSQISSIGNYANYCVSYNITQNRVQLKKSKTDYPTNRIGSKSNEMFLHLCSYLGLHKASFDLKANKLLPFLFIDQPSIPYFTSENTINSDSREKLEEAFRLLDSFINQINTKYSSDFQIILIEHASEYYWQDTLHNFHTVEVFRNGNKLIPQKYYNEQ